MQNLDYNKLCPKEEIERIVTEELKRQEAAKKREAEQKFINNLLATCKAQSEYAKNAKYEWESHPSIEKSKSKGTCVTYVACVLQRLGYINSGEYIWHNGKGYGTGKVQGVKDNMTLRYMGNKPIKSLKDELRAGDIILVDDNKSGEAGSGGHIFIFEGTWEGDSPYIWDNFSKGSPQTYGSNRKVLAIVRLKNDA